MSSNPKAFKVSCSRATLDQLRVFGERAKRLGLQRDFLDAVKYISARLAEDPLRWGDPQYRYRQLDLLLCRGIHRMLQAHYAVDETRRIVYVKEFKPLPGHPLGVEE